MPPKKNEAPEQKPLIGRIGTNLRIGIVGVPNVGKSTFFNVLTKSAAPAENFPFCTIDPNENKYQITNFSNYIIIITGETYIDRCQINILLLDYALQILKFELFVIILNGLHLVWVALANAPLKFFISCASVYYIVQFIRPFQYL